ncbi:MAG: hypothetical protein QM770_08795 [Tepidisphaeraceae bacterium]
MRRSSSALGRTVTALRPMGEAEFGVVTAQVISDFGPIASGVAVKVTTITPDGIARVRVVESSSDAQHS